MKKYMLKRVFAMVLITAIALLPIFEAGSVKAAIIDTSEMKSLLLLRRNITIMFMANIILVKLAVLA